MSSWWNATSASNFTRGITSITGQLSTNLKDILTEASEETYDPTAELTRARQQIEDLDLRKQALIEECTSLKKQCDELTMQKQAVEIKSDMLLAENRRVIEEKDNELKRLRENASAASWNTNTNDLNNTWTDILEDDQPEINEYLRYQRMIRELKDENSHLRDEMANLRKTVKSQKSEKNQTDIIQIEQMYSQQLSKSRQEYDEQIQKLQLRIKELEEWNENHQEEELRKSMEVQKEVDDVDKDLLSQELEQANQKLNWYSEKLKEYADLQINVDSLTIQNKQLQDDLHKYQEREQQSRELAESHDEDLNRLLSEERQRCDALAADNDSMFHLLEETKAQNLQIENNLKEKFQDEIRNKEKQFNSLINQIQSEKTEYEKQINQLNEEKNHLISQINNFQQLKDEQLSKQTEEEENRFKEFYLREMLEKQLIELNEDLQTLENDKNQLNHQVDDLKEQLQTLENDKNQLNHQIDDLKEQLQTSENDKNQLNHQINDLKEQLQTKDRQIQSYENAVTIPGSPSTLLSSSPSDTRGRSPSPQTFEHLLDIEAQNLRNEQQFHELTSVYDRFITLLPIELSSTDNTQLSLSDRFLNLFEQWSTYVDTLSITQQELDSVKQLLIEKQDDLEKLQSDLDLTTTKLIECQQQQQSSLTHTNKSFHQDQEENEDEIERILELHQISQRAPSRQSLISSTPGEKQQLIAQNELLSSLLAEKDRELISLQQAEKTREDLIKNLETLKINLQQMELDKEVKQVELNDIRNVLDEKLRENSSLKKEKMYFIEKLSEMERDRQEQQPIMQISRKQSTQEDEKPSTPITKDEQNTEQVHTQEQYEKLRTEFDQLSEFSKRQHDESLQYYNEYTRILSLYNDLNAKNSQLQIDYESLQSLIQQKNEGYLQCQNELNNYQNLLYHEKKKCEDMELIRSTLIERDLKLQQLIENETQLLVRQSELERDVKLLEQNNFELRNSEQSFVEQLQQTNTEQLHLDLKRSTHERDLAVVEKKQLENEIELNKQKFLQFEERERKLTVEIERLRTHLLKMEESYTTDLIAAEDREKTLRNQIAQLEDSNQGQNELIQQLNTSGEQSKQALATELGTLKHEYTKLETFNTNLNNQLQYQMKCSQNLQNVLEQFKREREQHLDQHLRQYQDALREQTSIATRLTTENNEIRSRLAEYNEALSAAHRLNDQIEKKDLLINTFRNEIHEKDKKIQQYEFNLRDLQSTSGSRVEKHLVKNILLSYFHTPVDKRQEVVPLLGALVGFTQEEYKKAIDATATNNSNNPRGASGWLTGWLGGNPAAAGGAANLGRARTQSETPNYDPNKSFTELLIQYVDQQSANNPQQPTAKFNTDEYLHRYDSTVGGSHHLSRKSSLSASANPFVNSPHLSLNRQPPAVVLPTSNTQQNPTILNPPPPPPLPSSTSTTTTNSESSSTILKDLLKA